MVFGSHQVRAPPHVGTREVPWPSPARGWSSPESWGLDLGLKDMAGPEPGASSDHPGHLIARRRRNPCSQGSASLSHRRAWAPGCCRRGRAGARCRNKGEKGSCPPTRSCLRGPETKDAFGCFTLGPQLPGCWGAGNFIWDLVSETAQPQGFGCSAGGQLGQDPS